MLTSLLLPLLAVAGSVAVAGSPPTAREMYDAALARRAGHGGDHASHAQLHAGLAAAHANKRSQGSHAHGAGMRKVRRKRDCAAPTTVAATATATTDAASTESSSSTEIESSSSTESSSSATAIGNNLGAQATTTSKSTTKTKSTSSASSSSTEVTTAAVSSSSSATSTSTSSSAAASSTSSSSLLSRLMPLGQGTAYWTTCTDASDALSVDGALKPLQFGSLPSASTAPDGSAALVEVYPANEIAEGFSFYTEGQQNSVEVTGASEVMFSYSAWFDEGFDFVKGGKMPGLYGGTTLAEAKTCSGGRQTGRDDCFSSRLMWRTDGMGELYNYYPTSVTQASDYCNYPPLSICDTVYGDSVGRGAYYWTPGQWTTVAHRVKLNDVGVANGEQELFVNGESVISISDVQIRTETSTTFYGIMAQTFFGGSDSTWAPPAEETAYFKDWTLVVLA